MVQQSDQSLSDLSENIEQGQSITQSTKVAKFERDLIGLGFHQKTYQEDDSNTTNYIKNGSKGEMRVSWDRKEEKQLFLSFDEDTPQPSSSQRFVRLSWKKGYVQKGMEALIEAINNLEEIKEENEE